MKDFIEKLHDQNIYVIGRITVFKARISQKAERIWP